MDYLQSQYPARSPYPGIDGVPWAPCREAAPTEEAQHTETRRGDRVTPLLAQLCRCGERTGDCRFNFQKAPRCPSLLRKHYSWNIRPGS